MLFPSWHTIHIWWVGQTHQHAIFILWLCHSEVYAPHWVPKRRFWKDWQKMKSRFSIYFSMVRAPSTHELKKCFLRNPDFPFCQSFQNLRLGGIKLSSTCTSPWKQGLHARSFNTVDPSRQHHRVSSTDTSTCCYPHLVIYLDRHISMLSSSCDSEVELNMHITMKAWFACTLF